MIYYAELLRCAEEQGFIDIEITYISTIDIIKLSKFIEILLKLSLILDNEQIKEKKEQ